jgi:hypothetical protein
VTQGSIESIKITSGTGNRYTSDPTGHARDKFFLKIAVNLLGREVDKNQMLGQEQAEGAFPSPPGTKSSEPKPGT